MKNDYAKKSFYQRFIYWMEGEPSSSKKAVEETPEHVEFMEYLEYLDAHEHIDFATYQKVRERERAARGMVSRPTYIHESVVEEASPKKHTRHHRVGWLRHSIRIYRVLSIAIALVLMATFLVVALNLPAFGSPDAPAVNEVSARYLEQGVEETGAVNAVAGMILDYRAFDTFGESTVLFAATMSVLLLLRRSGRPFREETGESQILTGIGRLVLPFVMMFGIYVVLNGHISPGGGFSGGTVLGCGLIFGALALGQKRMDALFPSSRITKLTVGCLLAYGVMKGYSFFTGANHTGWEIPKGTPGAIFSAGFILPLNICVGVIVACTMYTFYTLFAEKEA